MAFAVIVNDILSLLKKWKKLNSSGIGIVDLNMLRTKIGFYQNNNKYR